MPQASTPTINISSLSSSNATSQPAQLLSCSIPKEPSPIVRDLYMSRSTSASQQGLFPQEAAVTAMLSVECLEKSAEAVMLAKLKCLLLDKHPQPPAAADAASNEHDAYPAEGEMFVMDL